MLEKGGFHIRSVRRESWQEKCSLCTLSSRPEANRVFPTGAAHQCRFCRRRRTREMGNCSQKNAFFRAKVVALNTKREVYTETKRRLATFFRDCCLELTCKNGDKNDTLKGFHPY